MEMPAAKRAQLLDWLAGISTVPTTLVPYSFDYRLEKEERFATAEQFERKGWGDCADAVVWMEAYLRGLNIKAVANTVLHFGNPHVVNYLPDLNVTIDPTYLLFRKMKKLPWLMAGKAEWHKNYMPMAD